MKKIQEELSPKKFPILFVSIILFLVGAHIFHDKDDVLYVNALVSMVVIASAYTISKNTKLYKPILLFAGTFIILRWTGSLFDSDIFGTITLLLMTFYFFYIIKGLIDFLLKSKKVDLNVVLGVFSAYLLIGILFSFVFALLLDFNGKALNIEQGSYYADILYYTMITLSSIGYGDITPNSSFAQFFSYTCGITGQMYMGIVTAIIVGKFINKKAS